MELRLQSIEEFKSGLFKLRFDDTIMHFNSGQYIEIKPKNYVHYRMYSIYSGIGEKNLCILLRRVSGGYLSPFLTGLKQDDIIEAKEPHGNFLKTLNSQSNNIFISSGTGIAPFHSLIKSIPELNYILIQGIGKEDEIIDKEDYDPQKLVICSRSSHTSAYRGRVTDYIKNNKFTNDAKFYFCGSSEMIIEGMRILIDRGYDKNSMQYENFY